MEGSSFKPTIDLSVIYIQRRNFPHSQASPTLHVEMARSEARSHLANQFKLAVYLPVYLPFSDLYTTT